MQKVLHITPHMGGGVGKVLSRVCALNSRKYAHSILLLERPQKNNFIDYAASNRVYISILDDLRKLPEIIKGYDIIQIEWWQHPKTMKVLAHFPETPCKLLIWAHVNGCHYPYLSYDFAKYSNMVFTTEYSLNNPYWSDEQKLGIQKTVVYSSGGFDDCNFIPKKNGLFNIGYVGTLSFSKLNKDFIKYCSAANVTNSKFIMVGDKCNETYFESEAKRHNIDLQLCGYVNSPAEVISGFNVFGYPLSPYHFGTTENALLEAMAFGVVPICLNQNTEKYIIKNNDTGFLVNSVYEYGERIKLLYSNPKLLSEMSENTKEYVHNRFSVTDTANRLEYIYDNLNKNSYCFKDIIGNTPFEWFLSGLQPKHKTVFERFFDNKQKLFDIVEEIPVLAEESKGSVKHYYREFCDNEELRMLCELFN